MSSWPSVGHLSIHEVRCPSPSVVLVGASGASSSSIGGQGVVTLQSGAAVARRFDLGLGCSDTGRNKSPPLPKKHLMWPHKRQGGSTVSPKKFTEHIRIFVKKKRKKLAWRSGERPHAGQRSHITRASPSRRL
jgi:hypothetical protein